MRRFVFLAVVQVLCPAAALTADAFKLNSQEYFERPGINVMYGQDYYPEGHQGGLSICGLSINEWCRAGKPG